MSRLPDWVVGILHERLVFSRRVAILAGWFARLAPKGASILDVGCGDGLVSALLRSKRPDLSVRGIDVLARSRTHIPVELFNGSQIPFDDDSFDVVLFSDMLHHTGDPALLMREARRVAKQYVLIKDHNRNGFGAGARLRFMDWVGNARFAVALPYNYWTEMQWRAVWREIGLQPVEFVIELGLYRPFANWFFGARLHFVTLLKKCAPIH
jgi:SAM-dependent methyltransferase